MIDFDAKPAGKTSRCISLLLLSFLLGGCAEYERIENTQAWLCLQEKGNRALDELGTVPEDTPLELKIYPIIGVANYHEILEYGCRVEHVDGVFVAESFIEIKLGNAGNTDPEGIVVVMYCDIPALSSGQYGQYSLSYDERTFDFTVPSDSADDVLDCSRIQREVGGWWN